MKSKPGADSPLFPLAILVFITVFFTTLNSCSSHVQIPQAGADVRKADMKMVENCKYLGEVKGCDYERYTTDWRRADKYREIQITNARYEALQKAGALGATHIVWTGETTEERPCAHGIAYDCSKSGKRSR